jgi:PEP-CTERM motif
MKSIFAAAIAFAVVSPAAAANLIVNGDFETGTYAGWTTNVEARSGGNLSIEAYDGVAPISGRAYAPNALGGEYFSITDQTGPGAYSLTQSFTLATSTKIVISFDMFANNWSGVNINNGRLSSAGANQNAVVDILTGTAGAFTTNALDIVATLYGPGSDPIFGTNPWTSYSTTLMLGAGTYQIRFAEADNQLFFQQGVDNVSVSAVPEASTWAMLIAGFGLVGVAARRRRMGTVAA